MTAWWGRTYTALRRNIFVRIFGSVGLIVAAIRGFYAVLDGLASVIEWAGGNFTVPDLPPLPSWLIWVTSVHPQVWTLLTVVGVLAAIGELWYRRSGSGSQPSPDESKALAIAMLPVARPPGSRAAELQAEIEARTDRLKNLNAARGKVRSLFEALQLRAQEHARPDGWRRFHYAAEELTEYLKSKNLRETLDDPQFGENLFEGITEAELVHLPGEPTITKDRDRFRFRRLSRLVPIANKQLADLIDTEQQAKDHVVRERNDLFATKP